MAHLLSFAGAATIAAAMNSVHRAQQALHTQQQAEAAQDGAAGNGTATEAAAAPADSTDADATMEDVTALVDARIRKRKAEVLSDDASGADSAAASVAAAGSATIPAAADSDTAEIDMDTSGDDQRAPPLPALPTALSKASAATLAFLNSISLDTAAAKPAAPAAPTSTAPAPKPETDGSKSDAEDGEVQAATEEAEPFEPCMHYVSHGPAAAAALLAAQPPPPLPSYTALQEEGKLARTYPFTLDLFQQRSVEVLENRQHLLVAAHTSAGKTVVAE